MSNSLIVPAFNEQEVIVETVRHLTEIEDYFNEIYVVDDGSTDYTSEMVKEFLDVKQTKVQFIQLERNTSKVGAIKKAVEESNSDRIALMDADTRIKNPEKIIDAERKIVEEGLAGLAFKVVPDRPSGLREKMWSKVQDLDYGVGRISHLYTSSERLRFRGQKTVRCVPGAGGMYDRETILKAFEHHSGRHSGDDMELTSIIQFELGEEIELFDEIDFETHVPKNYSSLLSQRKRWSKGVYQSLDFQRQGFASEIRKMTRMGQIALYDIFLIMIAFGFSAYMLTMLAQGHFLKAAALTRRIYTADMMLVTVMGVYTYYKGQHDQKTSMAMIPFMPAFRAAIFFPSVILSAIEYTWDRAEGKGPTSVVEAQATVYKGMNEPIRQPMKKAREEKAQGVRQ